MWLAFLLLLVSLWWLGARPHRRRGGGEPGPFDLAETSGIEVYFPDGRELLKIFTPPTTGAQAMFDDRVKGYLEAHPPPEGWDWRALEAASGLQWEPGHQLEAGKYSLEPRLEFYSPRQSTAHHLLSPSVLLAHPLADALHCLDDGVGGFSALRPPYSLRVEPICLA